MSEDKTAASIDETNALRLAAGLAPLGKDAKTKAREAAKQHEEAARVAQQEAEAEALRAQLERAKNKRLLTAKVVTGKSLGEQLEAEEDDAKAFVRRQKKAAARRKKEKALAAKRARELEEQEAQAAAVAYTGRDLRGLAVQHDADSFVAGETRILTLADRGVLDESGNELNDDADMLVDVSMAEKERREQNAKDAVRKRYDVYAAADAAGGPQSLLAQYDKDDKGPGLVLDEHGAFDAMREKREARIAEQLDAQRNGRVLYDLEMLSNPVIASDTRTADEIINTAFKPRRRKKKKRGKTRNTAQLLAELAPDEQTGTGDHGSRATIKEESMTDGDEAAAAAAGQSHKDAYTAAVAKANTKARKRMAADAFGEEDEDDDEDAIDAELYSAVARARRHTAKKLRKTDVAADVLARRKALAEKAETAEQEGVVFSDTTQFISTLDAVTTDKTAADEEKKMKQEVVVKREPTESDDIAPEQNMSTSSTGVAGVSSSSSSSSAANKSTVSVQSVLSEEQPVSSGMGAALQHIRQRGMLDADDELFVGRRTDKKIKWEELNEIDERQLRDQRDLQRLSRRGRYDSRPESETRKYDINLVYKDDQGRTMTPKEAFRYLSYKFHGITPSHNKREKYLKRDEEMRKARKMTSTEQATKRLKAAQQRSHKAGIVLPK